MINPNDNRLKVAESSKPIQHKKEKDKFREGEKETKLNKVTIREVE